MRIFTLFCWLYSTIVLVLRERNFKVTRVGSDTVCIRSPKSFLPESVACSGIRKLVCQWLPNLNIWCIFLWGDTFQLVDETERRQESSRRKECWKSGEKEWKWFLVPLRVSFCCEVNFCHIKKSKPKSLFFLYPTPHSFSTQSPCPSSFIAVAVDRHKTSQGFLANGSVLGLLTTIRKGQDDGLQGATDPV